MAIPEGAQVSYVGDGEHKLAIGDLGRVLSDAGTGSHVLWSTGNRSGEIVMVADYDLVPAQAERTYDDSLDSGVLVTVAVREVHALGGSVALLNALNDEGHCASFGAIAEEAIQLVASRIRQDLAVREVLAQLDEFEGSEFVSLATMALLRDAFSGEED